MFCYKDAWYIPQSQSRQAQQVTWAIVAHGKTPNEAIREWYTKERKIASLLYPIVNKECSATTGGKHSTLR